MDAEAPVPLAELPVNALASSSGMSNEQPQPPVNGNGDMNAPHAAEAEGMDVDVDAAQAPAAPAPAPAPSQPQTPDVFSTERERAASQLDFIPVSSSRSVVPASTRQQIYRTGYVYDILMLLHCQDGYMPTDMAEDSGGGHPEEPMRIKRIFMRLKEAGLIARMKKLEVKEVTAEQVMQVHSEEHWQTVQGTETFTDEVIGQTSQLYEVVSLYVNRETAQCARLSCGGVIQACVAVCTGEVRNAFAIVRPPGHHAEPDQAMGFCFYNNVAVATKEVQRMGLAKKVMILDWDVHHGNGTQKAFWSDPSVLYMSIHRHDGGGFYPFTDFGALDMVGEGEGRGTSVNIPWPGAGHGDADYLYAFQKIIMPIAYEFAPDLVIISAGFDAAEGDTLGGCLVTPPAYGHMTHMLCALAGGKVVVALEGGYNLKAISDSALAVGQVLLGETPAELPPLQASPIATEVMFQVAKVQSEFWQSIDVKACTPPEITDEDAAVRTTIPDLLKGHRAHHLFNKHGLYQMPLASEDMREAFGGQVACSANVYEAGAEGVMVVFVHDFGNLRVETDGVASSDIHLANSYLLDTSSTIIDWATSSGYALIDVNVLAALPTRLTQSGKSAVTKGGPSLQAQLMKYLWDNYIELSECEKVVLIGHGTGCLAIMDLVNSRQVDSKVKAVVQVAGMHSIVRIDPNNESRRDWFRSSNRIYLPEAHPILEDDRARRRVGGQVRTAPGATKVVDVLNAALPEIQEYVLQQVGGRRGGVGAAGQQVNGNGHGPSNGHASVGGDVSMGEGEGEVEGVDAAGAGVGHGEPAAPAAAPAILA